MKKKGIAVAIYLILVIVCAIIIYLVPQIMGLFESSYIAKHGTLEVSEDVDALIIRDDTVYVAKKGGDINRLTEQTTLVRKGAKLLELSGAGSEKPDAACEKALERLDGHVKGSEGGCQKGGYVTYMLDGYEAMLTPETIDSITYEQYNEISDSDIVDMPDKKCAKGDPISRITSNGAWWILFYVDNASADRYIEGYTVDIVLEDEQIEGTVQSVQSGKSLTRVVVKSKMNGTNYLLKRKPSVKVITSNTDGIILEKDSLVTIGDTLGVIVIDKIGDKYFRPVKIKADDGKNVVVYEDIYMDDKSEFVETLDNYDEILTKPTEEDIEKITAEMKADSE